MSKVLSLLAALAALFMATPARASFDQSCLPSMKLFFSGFSGCDSVALLSPGNDTRVNLVFLLADAKGQRLAIQSRDPEAYPKPSTFTPADWPGFAAAILPPKANNDETSGEATICVSDAKGQADFIAAVAADTSLSEAEKAALKAAREAIACAGSTAAGAAPEVQSANAKEFAAYLAAITKFYQADHADAAGFAALANSPQGWVKEAARYMQARVLLLAGQAVAFDDYGTLSADKIDRAKVAAAKDAFEAYLKDYPQGAYAASATGLLRRAAWLGGNGGEQRALYAKLLHGAEVNDASIALINELDFKLPPDAYLAEGADPVFLAVEDLRRMREQHDDKGNVVPGMKAEVIEAQKARFAGQDDLYAYLVAARAWFVDHDAKAVLQALPERAVTADLTTLELSRQVLRLAAMDAGGDGKAARAGYVALVAHATAAYQRPALEMAIALSDEHNKHIATVFDADSPVKEPLIRAQVLDMLAGPILLRQQASAKDVPQDERDTAIYRLLSRDLVQGHFKGFVEDIKLLPPKPAPAADGSVQDKFAAFRWEGSKDGYACPDIVSLAQTLATNAKDVAGRLCLGEFFRGTGVADLPKPADGILGSTGTLFAGAPLARGDFYADIMKDAKASRDDRAYALFRAVHCYAPAHSNDCGGKDVDEATRKAWHDELKAKYGDTVWARQLKFYW
ncbi:MAG: hypothetical protein KGO53_01125 [Alphaproteobacteria bacterium]|nr:hypothetical protein [Alphaproteobacteria bacterium]